MTPKPLLLPTGTDLDKAYKFMLKERKKILPLVDKKNKITGLYVFSDLKRIKTGGSDNHNVDLKGKLLVGAAVGTGKDTLNRAKELIRKGVDVLVVDTAHGDSKGVIETVRNLKKHFPKTDIVAGNISVGESVPRLAEAGADGIKIGQGPGSICTTRIIAGIGRPQVSAIYDCAQVAEQYNIPICADGGLQNSGDIPIAIAAGAESVMLGSMLAGTNETPGMTIYFEGSQWKSYRGMGSIGAMESHKGSRERYGQRGKKNLIPEGVEGLVSYKGTLGQVITQYVGGLRSGMGYVGAASIKELQEKGDFEEITSSGFAESHPHDIKISKQPPNYRIDK